MINDFSQVSAIILAAGRGTRMKAKNKNKVTFNLGGRPMISYSVDNLHSAGINQIIVVVGFQAESVRAALKDTVTYATQSQALGTGDAVKVALPYVFSATDTVLTVYGDDSAFYPPSLYQEMINKLHSTASDLLVLTIHKDDPFGLGRIVRDEQNKIVKIVEEKVATTVEKQIKEINTGFYCFNKKFLIEHIDKIQQNPVSGEYYLTDLIEIALSHGKKVEALFIPDGSIWHGVNNRSDYARARAKLKV